MSAASSEDPSSLPSASPARIAAIAGPSLSNEQANKKTASSVAEFGNRLLTSEDNVWDFNAWDKVEWGEEQEREAEKAIEKQRSNPVQKRALLDDSTFAQDMYDRDAARFWDEFYTRNENKFFKDRRWLDIEFPEIFGDRGTAGKLVVWEVGCGVGNTLFPLLEAKKGEDVFVYASDFSATAVDIVKSNQMYDTARCQAFVFDITSDVPPKEIEPHTVDACTCIFVLSALHPSKWKAAVANLARAVKPGGMVLFRDYGRYDLTQLRLKGGRLLDDHFYIRGDGTQVYFYTQEEVNEIFAPYFDVLENEVDRRLLVNRSRKLKMHRIWVQAKFRRRAE
ncbi:S-adenosyl-L-methionine-dependent methyltransferase [Hyaloraphidium curvatum]|nr:S-adenosyl-L-methionine-dependent methyltransferase [Hyaloraphidium curvatum]